MHTFQGTVTPPLLYSVLIEEDADEGRCRNGNERPYDACQCCPTKQGDEDSESREVDAGPHDARSKVGVLDIHVNEVEDEDTTHFRPGVEGCYAEDEDHRDDASSDGNDVEHAHQDAKQKEVTDVEDAEDDGARYAEDQHEEALPEEPFADLQFCLLEGLVEARALLIGKQGEEEAVGVFAFEHEVDAEEGGREDVEEVRKPRGARR